MTVPARDPRRILITHIWSDRNRGDAALTFVTLEGLRRRFPGARLTLMSEFGTQDVRVLDETPTTRSRFPDVAIVGSLGPILPVVRCRPSPRWRMGLDGFVAAVHAVALLALAPMLRDRHALGRPARWFARCLCHAPENRAALDALLDADLLICRGGGYLHGQPRLRSTLRLARVLFPLRVGQRMGVPVALVGHSIGPFATRAQRAMTRATLARAAWISVREPRSAAEVRALLPDAAHLVVAPDLAWRIHPTAGPTIETLRAQMAKHPKPWVGVSVRHWPGEAGERTFAAVRAVCAHVRSVRGGTVFGWVQASGPGPLEDDRPLLQELAERDGVQLLAEDLDAEHLAALYAEHDIFVSARFHAAVFAMRGGVPTLAIDVGGPKLRGLMEALGLAEFLLDANTVDGPGVVAAFSALLAQRDDVHRRLTVRTVSYGVDVDATLDTALDIAVERRATGGA